MGARSLPIEQGRIGAPRVPRHLPQFARAPHLSLAEAHFLPPILSAVPALPPPAAGKNLKIQCIFDCPRFQSLRQSHAKVCQDSYDTTRSVMWHKDQSSVCDLVSLMLAIHQLSKKPRQHAACRTAYLFNVISSSLTSGTNGPFLDPL